MQSLQPVPSTRSFEEALFIATAAALTQKWPARDDGDHKFIAEKATRLTIALLEQYKRDFPREER